MMVSVSSKHLLLFIGDFSELIQQHFGCFAACTVRRWHLVKKIFPESPKRVTNRDFYISCHSLGCVSLVLSTGMQKTAAVAQTLPCFTHTGTDFHEG